MRTARGGYCRYGSEGSAGDSSSSKMEEKGGNNPVSVRDDEDGDPAVSPEHVVADNLRSSPELPNADFPSKTPEPDAASNPTVRADPARVDTPSNSPEPESATSEMTGGAPTDTGLAGNSTQAGKPEGSSCFAASECISSLACVLGQCAPPKKELDLCDGTEECAAGLTCVAPLYTLDGPTVFTCVRLVAAGAACNSADPARLAWPPASPQCGRGLVCSEDKCVRAPRLGDPCGAGGKPGLCEHGTACVLDAGAPTGVCKTVIPPFSGCDRPLTICGPGTICNNFPGKRASRECVIPKRAGEFCTSRYPCSTEKGLKCVRMVESLENDFVLGFAKRGDCLFVLPEGGACVGVANSSCGVGLGCVGGECVKKDGPPFVEILPDGV